MAMPEALGLLKLGGYVCYGTAERASLHEQTGQLPVSYDTIMVADDGKTPLENYYFCKKRKDSKDLS